MRTHRHSGSRPYRLYDEATAAAIFHELRRRIAWFFAGAALFCGALFFGGHTEEPILAALAGACEGVSYLSECAYSPLYDWLAGLLGLMGFGLLSVLLLRFVRHAPPPTVYCRHCDGAGWVRDLEPTRGRCPRCRQDRFTYNLLAVGPPPSGVRKYFQPDVSGEALITRWRHQTLWSRFWQEMY